MASADPAHGGVLAVSVDLEPTVGRRNLEHLRALNATADRLIDVLGTMGIGATWAVADPVHSVWTDRLLAAGAGHEVAVLGESNWVGHQAGRRCFARELARRVLSSRASGLAATTLVVHGALPEEHLDLVVKHGMTAVRGRVVRNRPSRRSQQPCPLRYGVWEVPVGLVLPGETKWFPGGGRFLRAGYGIRQASGGAYFHLVISVAQLAARGHMAQHLVERVLRRVGREHQQGMLRLETLGETAARLSNILRGVPAHSILRLAA